MHAYICYSNEARRDKTSVTCWPIQAYTNKAAFVRVAQTRSTAIAISIYQHFIYGQGRRPQLTMSGTFANNSFDFYFECGKVVEVEDIIESSIRFNSNQTMTLDFFRYSKICVQNQWKCSAEILQDKLCASKKWSHYQIERTQR